MSRASAAWCECGVVELQTTYPFHGVAVGGFIYATSAVLSTNEYTQAIDAKGQPIPALYAIGATAARDVQVCVPCRFASTSAFLAVNHVTA